ncbi:glyoxalase superfamily protein [Vibrio hepatarius]|uniref:glyoxalase superfamily protein n=1 Tax=Vibrio hepatarius TaxID=171383 RepID=UPI00142E442B|nr:glyoxalase superfamily protein [Vibrio hepatarius]NIY82393.1 lactoylglutathione lyase [Vibrio hepatarius]
MAKLIHSMIRVFDVNRSIAFYKDALDLDVAQSFEFESFSLIYLRNSSSDFELELTYNHDNSDHYTHGSGYGHIAVCVDDLASTHQRLVELNMHPTDIKSMAYQETPMAKFFFLTDPDGYKIEFLERLGRFQ